MKAKAGEVFKIEEQNAPVPGCTISNHVGTPQAVISHFSLAAGTDISPESYAYPKLWIVAEGELQVEFGEKGQGPLLRKGQVYITPLHENVGVSTKTGGVYTEIEVKEESMNQILKDKAVFRLADLLPYQEGKIINMDLVNDPKMKFVVMSFTKGTGLSEHAAPGEALIFALEGEGIIGYEGEEYRIHAGENFKFEKNGKHYVKAEGEFKMGLLIVQEE